MTKFSAGMTAFICCWFIVLCACSAPLAPINVDADSLALKGYDPVAYFTLGRPEKGKKEFEFQWNNTRWLFSSQQHLTLFKENPAKYTPQYGGY